MALLHLAQTLDRIGQGVGAVDDRRELAVLDEPGHGEQLLPVLPGRERAQPLRVERLSVTYDERGLVIPGSPIEQDEMAWIGQGAISRRTAEHPATSDAGVLLYRNLLLENIERIERGEDPMGLVRDPAVNWPFIKLRGERASAKMIQSSAASGA